jgi:hypothetical protein
MDAGIVLADQFLNAGHPDGGEHTVNVFLAWAYVAVNESVLLHDDGLELEARIYQRNREIVLAVGWNYKQEMNRDVLLNSVNSSPACNH